MFVLDTDVVSNLRKQKPHPALAAWLARTTAEQLFSTTVTVTEIQVGIERARREAPEVAAEVERWLEGMLRDGFPQFAASDVTASRLLGRMIETPSLRAFLASPPNARKPKTGADLAIAAIAITRGFIVVTGNIGDFSRIHGAFPLPGLYDPFQDAWHVRPEDRVGADPA
jgi:predicted nucleic acid-binding protein